MAGPLDKNYFTSAFEGEYNAPKYTTGTVYQLDNAGNAYKTVGGPLSETEEPLANRRKQRSDDNKQALLDQMAKEDPMAQYGRKPVPSFIPGAFALNALSGAGETQAERDYYMENPGQNPGLVNYYLGTGKYEPYHPVNVTHGQVYASGVTGGNTGNEGYGEANESGLGRNMNYDRFGNERTEMPTNVPTGSVYWNSTTGAWTDKTTGVPTGGSIVNYHSDSPALNKERDKNKTHQEIMAQQAQIKKEKENAAYIATMPNNGPPGGGGGNSNSSSSSGGK